ncbi:hypothetical protein PMNALOAF_2367 [Methylobacterium adhaesivum]|jgi:hypothetical protein|uniref:Uncharacterized protein n=1 Tax=Methylobacterium adhaesivum TaxID=333297 RepID=A0ABT8BHD7_9HYPH|nr:hypothetical protein [Methylobacterium adhaesivum]MDN3591557.1 hypothetical protein [Methylobacterium adhaesivum]GJD31114.1 hypothetical protein PMNALOAF_2367 [Methylobacterium adhaesivum]
MRVVLLVAGLLMGLSGRASAQPDPSPYKPRPPMPQADIPAGSSDDAQARRDRAEAARKIREKNFDDRVRRATSSICSNCTAGPSPHRRTRERAAPEPLDPMFDPAEAPALPD